MLVVIGGNLFKVQQEEELEKERENDSKRKEKEIAEKPTIPLDRKLLFARALKAKSSRRK